MRKVPWLLMASALALAAIGLVAIARCEEFVGSRGRYFWQQSAWLAIAVMAAGLTALPYPRRLCRVSYTIYGLAIALLVAVYFFPAVNGAHRWIRFGPIGFQPSELAKAALVLGLARYLMHRDSFRRLAGLLAPLGLTVLPMLLILREPDLGTSLLLAPVLAVMLFVAGARLGDLAKVAVVAVAILPVLWMQMSIEQRSRITSLFAQSGPGERPSNEGFQLHQGKQMIALGNVWGSAMIGSSSQDPAAYFLPEARCDFILCVIGERFGLVGIGVVLLLFGFMVWRGARIAIASRDPFARLAAVGATTLIGTQMLVNTLMNLGLLPVTGVSLPLVSYGGSGLVAYGLAIGLLINAAIRPGYDVAGEPFRWNNEH